jgi:hypothetical protein
MSEKLKNLFGPQGLLTGELLTGRAHPVEPLVATTQVTVGPGSNDIKKLSGLVYSTLPTLACASAFCQTGTDNRVGHALTSSSKPVDLEWRNKFLGGNSGDIPATDLLTRVLSWSNLNYAQRAVPVPKEEERLATKVDFGKSATLFQIGLDPSIDPRSPENTPFDGLALYAMRLTFEVPETNNALADLSPTQQYQKPSFVRVLGLGGRNLQGRDPTNTARNVLPVVDDRVYSYYYVGQEVNAKVQATVTVGHNKSRMESQEPEHRSPENGTVTLKHCNSVRLLPC